MSSRCTGSGFHRDVVLGAEKKSIVREDCLGFGLPVVGAKSVMIDTHLMVISLTRSGGREALRIRHILRS